MGNILAGDDQIVTAIVHATQDDVGVRAFGVEMVDRHPIQLGAEILLDLRHQAPDIGFEIGIFGTVLGRRSEEHTSELQSLMRISYAFFCLKKKTTNNHT